MIVGNEMHYLWIFDLWPECNCTTYPIAGIWSMSLKLTVNVHRCVAFLSEVELY